MNGRTTFAAALLAALCGAASAQVEAQGAWARASVQGQSATGAFMTLTARQASRLVGVSTPAAGVAQVHEMRMDGDVMRMRAIAGLALPAGVPVELKPGGYHLMLMDLKAPLKIGTTVPVTLVFRDASGKDSTLELSVPVSARAPGAAAPAASAHKH